MPIRLDEISLFKGLSQRERESTASCLREKIFKKGEVLFHEGKQCERVFIVRSGRVKLYRIASNGREQIVESLEPGDTCACNPGMSQWSCASTAEAVTDCTVWFLSREDYVRVVQTHAEVARALNRLFADRLRCLGALIEDVSLKDVKSRLVKFLLDMLERAPTPSQKAGVLNLPFTREEIAQRIGAARETVARQLYQLKRAKLIDIQPRRIVILDKSGLEGLL